MPTPDDAATRWPRFEADEVEAAARVLRSGRVNYWTGDEGRAFEREFAGYVGASHGIALANGTVALELALWALGIDGGEVIVPARTFIATASAVRMRGATPVFADVDPDSGGLTAATVEACLTADTRAVFAVHLGGWPCDIEAIAELCRARAIPLLEDCAQAHGATVGGRQVGTFGVAAAFSFCQDKIMTTAGEGGMLVTSDEALWKRAWSYKDHGKDWDVVHRPDHPPGFRWLHERLGTNWRLSEVQSAVGRVQLAKLNAWLAHRRSLTARLHERLDSLPGLRMPSPPPTSASACYKAYAYVVPEVLRADWSRDRIIAAVNEAGHFCQSGSCSEIYREEAFPPAMRPRDRLATARRLGETSVLFRVDPTVPADAIDATADALTTVMREAAQ